MPYGVLFVEPRGSGKGGSLHRLDLQFSKGFSALPADRQQQLFVEKLLDICPGSEFTLKSEKSSQVSTEGHGLGLSIVRRILNKLGGKVGVESERLPGRGCTFSFYLPKASAKKPAS